MSIINDALKKTEQLIQNKQAQEVRLARKPSPNPFLLFILILLAGFSLGNFIFGLLGHKINSTQPPKKIVTAAAPIVPTPALTVAPPAEENKPPKPTFVLNGIFFSGKDGYALVNNQIVRENDYVEGARVNRITPTTVELDNQGEVIFLNTLR